jgi:lipopolysaccharide/colanic/teichoic acid biosynthesis glycosyltransferase
MSLQYIERASAHSLPTLSPIYQQYYEQNLGYRVVLLPFLKLKENIRDRLPDILIIPAHTSPAEVLELQKIARIYGIRVELLQIDGSTAQYAHIDTDGDFPVLSIEYIRISTWGRLLKRVFDIIFGIIFLILFAPIMLIIALAIKWDDPSAPVIYRNKRTGKNGELFTLYKFRYMQWQYSVKDAYGVDPESDSALKFEHELRAGDKNSRTGPIYKITQGDPRHTRVGSLIERLSLDELPQLFNVLIGNMSLVGPRPHQPREVENYDEWHKQVLTVKPGITGMAQVFAREAADFDREAELDISYIENWSMPLDIWLLVSTLRVLIIKRHG